MGIFSSREDFKGIGWVVCIYGTGDPFFTGHISDTKFFRERLELLAGFHNLLQRNRHLWVFLLKGVAKRNAATKNIETSRDRSMVN